LLEKSDFNKKIVNGKLVTTDNPDNTEASSVDQASLSLHQSKKIVRKKPAKPKLEGPPPPEKFLDLDT